MIDAEYVAGLKVGELSFSSRMCMVTAAVVLRL